MSNLQFKVMLRQMSTNDSQHRTNYCSITIDPQRLNNSRQLLGKYKSLAGNMYGVEDEKE